MVFSPKQLVRDEDAGLSLEVTPLATSVQVEMISSINDTNASKCPILCVNIGPCKNCPALIDTGAEVSAICPSYLPRSPVPNCTLLASIGNLPLVPL